MSIPMECRSMKDHGHHLLEHEAVSAQRLYAPVAWSSRGACAHIASGKSYDHVTARSKVQMNKGSGAFSET